MESVCEPDRKLFIVPIEFLDPPETRVYTGESTR